MAVGFGGTLDFGAHLESQKRATPTEFNIFSTNMANDLAYDSNKVWQQEEPGSLKRWVRGTFIPTPKGYIGSGAWGKGSPVGKTALVFYCPQCFPRRGPNTFYFPLYGASRPRLIVKRNLG